MWQSSYLKWLQLSIFFPHTRVTGDVHNSIGSLYLQWKLWTLPGWACSIISIWLSAVSQERDDLPGEWRNPEMLQLRWQHLQKVWMEISSCGGKKVRKRETQLEGESEIKGVCQRCQVKTSPESLVTFLSKYPHRQCKRTDVCSRQMSWEEFWIFFWNGWPKVHGACVHSGQWHSDADRFGLCPCHSLNLLFVCFFPHCHKHSLLGLLLVTSEICLLSCSL